MANNKERDDKILGEIKRHNKVLMEHMGHQAKTVAEQYGTIIKKLDGHDAKFERIEQRFDRLEMAALENSKMIKEVNIKVDKIDRKLETATTHHEQRIRRVEEKIGI